MNEGVSPKRSPKRRGPTTKYAPETTDVSPVKKGRHKAVPKRGTKATTPTSATVTAIASTTIAIPEMEFPMPSTTPYDGMNEMNQVLFCFQSFQTRFQEELNRQRLVIGQQHKMIDILALEKKDLMERLAEKPTVQDPFADFRRETLERMMALMHNFELQTRGAEIVNAAISAAGGLETGAQAQPT